MNFKYTSNILNTLLGTTLTNHITTYPTPRNLSYFWSFGSLAGFVLISQIVTGILLAMHYTANIYNAFADLEHIMRDVVGGHGLRYLHANGASMFFIVVYTHIIRGMFYGSYMTPRTHLWFSGIALFICMMAAAFMGYVLPWGQMSFWGATVITNLFSAIPEVGPEIVKILWGGFSVDNPTLNRFLSLHFTVPFIIAGLAILHLVLLHEHGSNNPLGIDHKMDKIPFFTFFMVKDIFSFSLLALIAGYFIVHAPDYLGHPDNYIEAEPLVTPPHIVPEWYFLPFYAILRAVPDKLAGVISMFWAIIIIALLPWFETTPYRVNYFKPFNYVAFVLFVCMWAALGWLGQAPVEYPFLEFSIVSSIFYFGYFKSVSLAGILRVNYR